MSAKIINFNQALDQMEIIDSTIANLLENEAYAEIIDAMNKRLGLISQLTKIKANQDLSEEMKNRLNKIFNSASSLQAKVKLKMDKISERLKERRKIKTQNKKIAY
jgi:chorismate mutase